QGTTGPSLLNIQGYSTTGTGGLGGGPLPSQPIARSVVLSTPAGSTCSDAYFTTTAPCTESISATIDYGSNNLKGVSVKPVVAGVAGTALTGAAGSGTSTTWTGAITLSQAGANQIDLQVTCTKGANALCGSGSNGTSTSATITNVQRPYVAGANSGSISGAWVSEVGGLTQDADSFQSCASGCSHNLI